MHNFNLQEKTTSIVDDDNNLHTQIISLSMKYFDITKEVIPAEYKSFFSKCALNFLMKFVVTSTVEVVFSCRLKLCTMTV